jgi:hypothetical protein
MVTYLIFCPRAGEFHLSEEITAGRPRKKRKAEKKSDG